MPKSRAVRLAILLSAAVVARLLVACTPPGAVLSNNGCHVLKPLAGPLPPHVTLRVRVVTSGSGVSLSRSETIPTANPLLAVRANQLRNALVEALAQREDLLVNVVGWTELQSYRSHLADKRRNDRSGDWEFEDVDTGGEDRFDLSSLLDTAEWESAPYEVIGMVGDERYGEDTMNNPLTGGTLGVPTQSATVRVGLLERESGQTIMDVSIPVRGDDFVTDAARRFAGELAAQVWRVGEGETKTESGL